MKRYVREEGSDRVRDWLAVGTAAAAGPVAFAAFDLRLNEAARAEGPTEPR